MARVLMSIVIVFLCSHSPKIVVNFYEALQVLTDQLIGVFFFLNATTFRATLLLTVCSWQRGVFLIFFQMVRHGHLREHPTWLMVTVKVNHLLLTLNAAANILIYSFKVACSDLTKQSNEQNTKFFTLRHTLLPAVSRANFRSIFYMWSFFVIMTILRGTFIAQVPLR